MDQNQNRNVGDVECPLVLDMRRRNSEGGLKSNGVPEERGAGDPGAQEIGAEVRNDLILIHVVNGNQDSRVKSNADAIG